MAEPAIEDDVVREVLDDALPDDWNLQVVDGDAAVLEHSGANVMADVTAPNALMRMSGYQLKYVARLENGDFKLTYVEQ